VRIETAQPTFSLLEGGLFVQQANTLLDLYGLRQRWEKTDEDLILGPEFGRLDNRQILYLLAAAVSRVIGGLPSTPASHDYRVHGAILSLYRGYCKAFLNRFPHQAEEQTILLASFLDRVVENNLGQAPSIEYTALNREHWQSLVAAGQRLLEHQFPVVPPTSPFQAPPPRGYEPELACLVEAGEKLRLDLIFRDDLPEAEGLDKDSRPARQPARRDWRRQLEPAW